MWLDMTGIDADHMHEVLPQVVETIEKYADLDPTHDFVPVKPTAHYTMGGIPITTDGEVYRWQNDERNVVEGLFAAGECACVSVHGANRLGGNSLLDACLFGTRSGKALAERISSAPVNDPMAESDADNGSDAVQQAADTRSNELKDLLVQLPEDEEHAADQSLPADGRSGYRHGTRCRRALRRAGYRTGANGHCMMSLRPVPEALHAHSDSPTFNQEITAIWEVRHLLELGKAVLTSSDARHDPVAR